MFRYLPYLVKGLLRHRVRTLTTAMGAAVGLFVFCCVTAVQESLDRLTDGDGPARSLIVFQENRFCPATSQLPQEYASRIAELPGVTRATPVQVYTNNCRASLDIVVFNGMPPQTVRNSQSLTLLEGDWSRFVEQQDAAVVGQALARRRGLAVGDSFTIGTVTVQVVGIAASSIPAEENLAFTHLDFLQRTHGMDRVGLCTQVEVELAPEVSSEAVASQIDEMLRAGSVPTTTRSKGAFEASTLGDLIDLIGFAHWLAYASVGLVLALVGTTTLMSVQDRLREHAVLHVLGLRPGRVARLVLSESVLLCLVGGLVGTALCLGMLYWGGLAIGAEGVTLAFQPSLQLALSGAVVSGIVGVVAGAAPAWQAARLGIVPALQQR